MSIDKIKSIVARSAIYVPENSEGIRIDYWDSDSDTDLLDDDEPLCFYGTGEESGEEYCIEFSEVDLDTDMFYELKLVDING